MYNRPVRTVPYRGSYRLCTRPRGSCPTVCAPLSRAHDRPGRAARGGRSSPVFSVLRICERDVEIIKLQTALGFEGSCDFTGGGMKSQGVTKSHLPTNSHLCEFTPQPAKTHPTDESHAAPREPGATGRAPSPPIPVQGAGGWATIRVRAPLSLDTTRGRDVTHLRATDGLGLVH